MGEKSFAPTTYTKVDETDVIVRRQISQSANADATATASGCLPYDYKFSRSFMFLIRKSRGRRPFFVKLNF
ncbi:MAG: hypothetical protein LBU34_13235 [Planctomycetaceae bacterium]|nr:hypothetical protein [Planctomycetaceae bacterium]